MQYIRGTFLVALLLVANTPASFAQVEPGQSLTAKAFQVVDGDSPDAHIQAEEMIRLRGMSVSYSPRANATVSESPQKSGAMTTVELTRLALPVAEVLLFFGFLPSVYLAKQQLEVTQAEEASLGDGQKWKIG
jgi:hypothetical protein